MFERYTICSEKEIIEERFSIEINHAFKQIYNAAPSMLLPVIVMDQPTGLSTCYWGQPPGWTKKKSISEKLISVRSELIPQKPVFQKKLKNKRCLVPADGLYLWKKIGKKSAIPYRYILQNNDIFSMAGIWEDFEDEGGKSMHTFMLVTVPSKGKLQNFTDRLPMMLTREAEQMWLKSNALEEELLKPSNQIAQKDFEMYSVSPRVNSVENNEASLILPAPPADQFGNLSLFD